MSPVYIFCITDLHYLVSPIRIAANTETDLLGRTELVHPSSGQVYLALRLSIADKIRSYRADSFDISVNENSYRPIAVGLGGFQDTFLKLNSTVNNVWLNDTHLISDSHEAIQAHKLGQAEWVFTGGHFPLVYEIPERPKSIAIPFGYSRGRLTLRSTDPLRHPPLEVDTSGVWVPTAKDRSSRTTMGSDPISLDNALPSPELRALMDEAAQRRPVMRGAASEPTGGSRTSLGESTGLPVSSRSDCFIATAACGTPQAEDVVRLREFRDRILKRTAIGLLFVAVYELVSPPFSRIVARSDWARGVVRRWVVRPCRRLADWLLRDVQNDHRG